jgi:hypothetical protein
MELIIVIGLMGVAVSLGTVMFLRVTEAWGKISEFARMDAMAHSIFDQVRQDVAEVVSAKKASTTIRGVMQNAHDNEYVNVTFADDRIVLPVELAPNPNAPRTRAEVEYWVDRKSNAHSLVRTVRIPGNADASASEIRLNDSVLAFLVEYCGKEAGSPWQREWNKPVPPSAVRVTVTLMGPGQQWRQIVRKAVFPVQVD